MLFKNRMPMRVAPKNPSIFDWAAEARKIAQFVTELNQLKQRFSDELTQKSTELLSGLEGEFRKQMTDFLSKEVPLIVQGKTKEVDSALRKMNSKLASIEASMKSIQAIQKGEKGEQGAKGDTPTIDEEAIVEKVLLNMPKMKPVEQVVDHEKVAEKVLGAIIKSKKLKTEHIDGFEQTLAPIRHLAAGFRGGGDTVDAGTGISISTVNGKKVITSTVTGLSVLTATGTVDDSNTVFTFASEPTLVVVNGVSYRHTHGVTIAGTTATLDNPPGVNGDVYGLG